MSTTTDRDNIDLAAFPPAHVSQSTWTQKYGRKHRWERVEDLPRGVVAPRRVRIYRRADHFILQWWDVAAKRNLSLRIDGDLVAAIAKAREIEERLDHFRSSGIGRRRIRHCELVEAFVADLNRRADAGEIDPRTVSRYGAALNHYIHFTEQPQIQAAFPSATRVNRDFALQLAAYLRSLRVAPNGHAQARTRPIKSAPYVSDVARAMFRWATDSEQGNLMPTGFQNPFAGRRHQTDAVARDLFGDPDITIEMAAEFFGACDAFQLPLFTVLVLYGLRAAEPCYILQNDVTDDWLKVVCRPQLGYVSKGRRDKRLPLVEPLSSWLKSWNQPHGVLFVRRTVFEGREQPSLLGASLEELQREFDERCRQAGHVSAADRTRIRDALFRDAGGLRYDDIEREFGILARRLGWPREATLKDFRHLFSTSMENCGMPLFYRRYFMGQSPGRTAIVNYTHLSEPRHQFVTALERTLKPLVDIAVRRGRELGLPESPNC